MPGPLRYKLRVDTLNRCFCVSKLDMSLEYHSMDILCNLVGRSIEVRVRLGPPIDFNICVGVEICVFVCFHFSPCVLFFHKAKAEVTELIKKKLTQKNLYLHTSNCCAAAVLLSFNSSWVY